MLELIAMGTMLIDHVGIALFNNHEALRMIGRIAFPIYCYLLVLGYQRTRNIKKYGIRLLCIAIYSQVPYWLLFDNGQLNVVFTLLLSLVCLYTLDNCPRKKITFFVVGGIILCSFFLKVDYGPYGVILPLIYRCTETNKTLMLHIFLNILFIMLFNWPLFQMFSVIGTVFTLYHRRLPVIKVNRGLFRSFYPLHLSILLILVIYLSKNGGLG